MKASRGRFTPAATTVYLIRNTLLVFGLACLAALAQAGEDRFESLDSLPPTPPALQAALEPLRGQAVLINFWASWCEPCRNEMPALVSLSEMEEGVGLVTVAVADREADIRKFLEDNLVEPVVVPDPEQMISRAWGVRMIPTTIFLDRQHRPRYRVRGDLDWFEPSVRERVQALAAPR